MNTKDPRLTGAMNPAPAPTLPPDPGFKMGEPEDAVKEFTTESGAFAIVDAAILSTMKDSPIAQNAVVFQTKSNVAFEIKAEYDDTVLRTLSMAPKEDESEAGAIKAPGHESHGQDGSSPEVVPPEVAMPGAPQAAQAPQTVPEGIAPLSHDSSPERAIRKHTTPRSRRHMDGSDRYRKNSPVKRVMARLKRTSRHQPDVEEAFSFIAKYNGKPVTERDVKDIQNPQLLGEALGVLMAMAMGGWEALEEGVTNGSLEIIDKRFTTNDSGSLLLNNKELKLDFNWIYEARTMLQKNITESAINLGRTLNG